MDNFDYKKFIEDARKKGVPDKDTFNYLKSKGLIPKESVVTAKVEPEKKGGFIADTVNTLLVKPAARATELIGRTGVLGETVKKGYEEMAGQDQKLQFGDHSATVEGQKALG